MRQADYQVSEDLLRYVSDLFGMVGQSKISEDGMHFERRGESATDSKTMGAERRWSVLVDEKILSREHRFKEVGLGRPQGLGKNSMHSLLRA